ncbi:hypothetical protein GW17_00035291 [Ensete ventricosum]|nr:hypothetical protein GW17_00035291 [Ensete ventricosum]RZS21517.1 hypothetical protein BHM03_00054170 [Ensete ventricosum]
MESVRRKDRLRASRGMRGFALLYITALTRHHALGDPPLTRSKAMDRDGVKRGREEQEEKGGAGVTPAVVSKKKKKGKRNETAEGVSESCRVGTVDVFRPPGLFEFPWQKGERLLVPEPDGWDLRDVFFSSLVDGCSAAIGVPGDRLSPAARHPFVLLEEPSDGEVDGSVDCIWSSVLRQPLSMYSKSYTA